MRQAGLRPVGRWVQLAPAPAPTAFPRAGRQPSQVEPLRHAPSRARAGGGAGALPAAARLLEGARGAASPAAARAAAGGRPQHPPRCWPARQHPVALTRMAWLRGLDTQVRARETLAALPVSDSCGPKSGKTGSSRTRSCWRLSTSEHGPRLPNCPQLTCQRRARCIVPRCDGVPFDATFRTALWAKYSPAAPAQRRQYGALSSVVRKAYKA